jgi:hypothetical protein
MAPCYVAALSTFARMRDKVLAPAAAYSILNPADVPGGAAPPMEPELSAEVSSVLGREVR